VENRAGFLNPSWSGHDQRCGLTTSSHAGGVQTLRTHQVVLAHVEAELARAG
jgi:hypothetical protein